MHKNDRASWKRSLVLVWLGEAFSVLTSSVLQMGLIWHVTLTTGSAGALSLVSLVGFLPMAVLGVFAETIVDRSSIKRLMIGATGGFKHLGVSRVLAIALFGVTTLASGLLPASAFALFLAFTFAMGYRPRCIAARRWRLCSAESIRIAWDGFLAFTARYVAGPCPWASSSQLCSPTRSA